MRIWDNNKSKRCGGEKNKEKSEARTSDCFPFTFFYFFLGAEKTGQGFEKGMKSTPPM